ncbi:signal peptidase I [Brevundimonas subvibrioides]|uniref:signal peptidase I n=1 Tax=Brevundimonas subvibrioides TaxID=74313 RepID=UPI003B2188D2
MSEEIKHEPHADEAHDAVVPMPSDDAVPTPDVPVGSGEETAAPAEPAPEDHASEDHAPEHHAAEHHATEHHAPATTEEAFAASESDAPEALEAHHEGADEPEAPAEQEPAIEEPSTAPAAETDAPVEPVAAEPVTSSSAPQPIWSDQGDAPFDDHKEKIPAAARVAVRDEDEGGSAASETLEIVKTIVVALAIAFVLRVLLFQPFTIPSASMEPNLYEGDYIVVSKWTYGYSRFSSGLPVNLPLGDDRVLGRAPNRGDIVVFKLPRDDKTDYIKRVIGLPGDKIQMIANKLYINGTPVQDVTVGAAEVADVFGPRPVTEVRETLPNGKTFMTQDFGPGGDLDDTGVYEVPVGYYFMMGDNRDNSIDSRVQQSAGVGLVPDENLVGKAEIIMFSWSPGASLWNPVSWFQNIRLSRFFKILD